MQKALVCLAAVGFVAGCATPPASKPIPPPPAPPVLIGTPTSQPQSPALQALQSDADQQMLVRFTVLPDGSVQHPHTIFTLLSAADTAVALDALQQWRFKPATEGAQAVAREFMYPLFFGPDAARDRTRFFCRNQNLIYKPDSSCEIVNFGHWQIFRMDPVYPANLLDQRLAGSVTLSFDVNPHGAVQNPKVVSATPPGAFDAAALTAVRQWYFEPLQEQKDPTPEQHVTVTVKFSPPAVSGTQTPAPAATTQPTH